MSSNIYFLVQLVLWVWYRRIKQNSRLTATCTCRGILEDGSLGNWYTDCVPTGAPAHSCWQSSASMTIFQHCSTIKNFLWDSVDHGTLVNTITPVHHFAALEDAFYYWWTLWSPIALGYRTFWSVLGFGGGSTCAGDASSDSDNVMRRVDF